MLSEYRRFFERRTNGRAGMPRVTKKRIAIYNSWIDDAKEWEPDARYFLIYNLHLMLIAPIQSQHSGFQLQARPPFLSDSPFEGDGPFEGRERFDAEQFLADLAADVDQIIREADDIARSRDRRYVSSTSVAMALGKLAPEMRTARWQVWGPREDEYPMS